MNKKEKQIIIQEGKRKEEKEKWTKTVQSACPPPRKASHSKGLRNSKGFTLAEILITLAIIGVVAVLTVPTLMQKYQEQVTVTKVKKIYNVMSNALKMAINENGTLDTWDIKSNNELIPPIIKHLKIQKDCGTKLNSGCIPNESYYLNGNYNYNYDNSNYGGGYYKIILQDGSTLWLRWAAENPTSCKNLNGFCGQFWYDINGKKKPNTLGKDIFYFHIRQNRLLADVGYCNNPKTDIGWGCAANILKYGNMDYLRK